MGRKRKNAQNIKTQLRAKSTAQLEKALEGMLDVPDPEETPDFDSEEWCGASPPHMINGQTYEERQKRKKEKQDEKARQSK
jgi:uncharacterized protein YmfQ (DUF2313 family)